VTLAEILDFAVPRGWFLPVSPGTKYVTVGGAIANDIHGKNHHLAGTFGRHTPCFELVRVRRNAAAVQRDAESSVVRRYRRRHGIDRADQLG